MNSVSQILFQTTDWSTIPVTSRKGESGTAYYQTLQFNGLRIRLVEYSKDFLADHWCKAGHIVHCLEGEMQCHLSDGRVFKLSKGMSYVVSDNVSNHRSVSTNGVKLLIIDGEFLKTDKKTLGNPWRM